MFTQSKLKDTQAGVVVPDGRTIALLSYAQAEYVTVDMHKPSENGSLIGVSSDIVNLPQWYPRITLASS